MRIFDYFRSKETTSARIAKERLQVIVAHERNRGAHPDYLPQLQEEILAVIRKYIDVTQDDVNVQVDKSEDYSVLELNITLPEAQS